MSKKKRRASVLAASMATLLAIGGTVAYLTASDNIVNKFELETDMSTKVVEPSWDPAAGKGVVPTQAVQKDPAVMNDGKVASYVALKVKAPVFDGKVYDPDSGTVDDVASGDLFGWQVGEGWTLVETEGPEDGFKTYTYVHDAVVEPGETTGALFSEVVMANLLEDVGIDATSITVNAEAIQSTGFSNAQEAYQALKGQNGSGEGGGSVDPEPGTVSVSFVSNGGTVVKPFVGEPGSELGGDLPATERLGYDFEGWFDKDGSEDGDWGAKAEGMPGAYPESDSSYYAKWTAQDAQIVFNTGAGTAIDAISGKTGDAIADTAIPETFREGYTCTWTATNTLGVDLSGYTTTLPETIPAGTTVYVANWKANPATVTFDFQVPGIDNVVYMGVTNQEFVKADPSFTALPEAPERDGFTFEGWFDKDGNMVEYDALTKRFAPGDVVYTAKWSEAEVVTVKFDMGDSGIAQIADQSIPAGSTPAKPSGIVVENGYEVGFYSDAACTQEYDFTAPVSSDATVYVKAVPAAARIVFNTNGGTEVASIEGYTGMELDVDVEMPTTTYAGLMTYASANPSYQFDAWYTEDGSEEGDPVGSDENWGDPVTSFSYFKYSMPAGETVLNARYYDSNDNSVVSFAVLTSDGTLSFYRRDAAEIPTVGASFNGTVEKVYVGDGVTASACNEDTDWYNRFQWYDDRAEIKKVDFVDAFKITDARSMFAGCLNITEANLENLDMKSVVRAGSMFGSCSSLTEIDMSITNMKNTKDASAMFSGCYKLEKVDTTGWEPSFTSTYQMFMNCYNLTEAGIEDWDVSKVTSFSMTFQNCYRIKTLDLSNWDTGNCTSFYQMFTGSGIETLNLAGWDVRKVTDKQTGFSNMLSSSLKYLNMSNWKVNPTTKGALYNETLGKAGIKNSIQLKLIEIIVSPGDLSDWEYYLQDA